MMNSNPRTDKHTCILIGMDTLLLECAQRLLDHDFQIVAILSDAPRVKEWADRMEISILPAEAIEEAMLTELPCSYLFSITWNRPLPGFLLHHPGIAAINIQDSPLPQYSGPNGPAWALIADERHYGICWHLAEETLGMGDLLQEVPVAIEIGDTSLSLNMKCFEAALSGFDVLLEELPAGRLTRVKPDESTRRPLDTDLRPEQWGCLDWNRPAKELEALVRALDFGNYRNTFCMAKLLHQDGAIGVTEAMVDGLDAPASPGTVLEIDEDGVLLATAEGGLRMCTFRTLRGRDLKPEQVAQRYGWRVGQVLRAPQAFDAEGLKDLLNGVTESEAAWVVRLAGAEPVSLVYDRQPDRVEESVELRPYPVVLPMAALAKLDAEARRQCLRDACLIHLHRLSRQSEFRIRYLDPELFARCSTYRDVVSASVPLTVALPLKSRREDLNRLINNELLELHQLPPFLIDLQARSRDAATGRPLTLPGVGLVLGDEDPDREGSYLVYRLREDGSLSLEVDPSRLAPQDAEAMASQLATIVSACLEDTSRPIAKLPLLPEELRQRLVVEWNDSDRTLPPGQLVHERIQEQAQGCPQDIAIVAGGKSLTYEEMESQAEDIAVHLSTLGVGPGSLVGVCLQRTTRLPAAVLGILKAGAAYLPLDPDFPPSRLRYMIEDSGVEIVLSDCLSRGLVEEAVTHLIAVDQPLPPHSALPRRAASPQDLAYVIYTSGSTGNPKGVMLEHEQVCNFFLGMDERLGTEPGVWLAVTSLSFDISVLELLWTLTRGYKVVLFEGFDRGQAAGHVSQAHGAGQLTFSLMLWGASGGGPGTPNPYRLMLDAARFGDDHGFEAIWLPERHFHEFGGPYPNPAVAASAVAAVTKRIQLRTGSVVLPLHNPILMAEDWAMVDNLSGGRVGLAIASGWHPNDFVLEPESYSERREVMRQRIGTLRSLWRGEALELPNPVGETPAIVTRPRPVQAELPIWLTAAGNPETFRLAGEMGFHILTHLLGQTPEEVASKVAIYRQAWKHAGHPGSGHVTMMLHTMLGADREEMYRKAKGPMCSYLATAADLLKDHMSAWAAVRTPMNRGKFDTDFHLDELDPADVQDLLDFAYDRYFGTSALLGTTESCQGLIASLREMEVDEVACLIDFGAEPELILQQLPYLEELRRSCQVQGLEVPHGEAMEQLIAEHQVTHLQCTPSMATMMLAEPAIAEALGSLEVMMVGGEALTEDLASQLRNIVPGRVMNMYGLTETAIWSSTADIVEEDSLVTLGEPLANNRFFVLDEQLELVPPGLPGELYIAGLGVARGYLGRPDLTAQVFLKDPFDSSGKGTIYRSGDQVVQLEDGRVRFLGRGDSQVKVNGYRIELGEIEAALLASDGIRQAAVLVSHNPLGGKVLVAHYVAEVDRIPEVESLRRSLRTRLPEYMIPREFHLHERFPQTNNGKTDRNALAAGPPKRRPEAKTPVAKVNQVSLVPLRPEQLELRIAEIWQDILGLEVVDHEAKFFDLGGHSLLTISLKRILKAELGIDVALTVLFQYATIRSLAAHLAARQEAGEPGNSASGRKMSAATKRAALRRSRRVRD